MARALAALNIPDASGGPAAAAPRRGAEGTSRASALGHFPGALRRAPLSRRLPSGMSRATKKARRSRPGRRSKLALVCAGGGVTGAVYEIGCLRALDELVDLELVDARPLRRHLRRRVRGLAARGRRPAAGDVRRGRRPEPQPAGRRLGRALPPRTAWSSCAAPGALRVCWPTALRTSLSGDGRNWSDLAWSLFELLPAGLLETSGIQEYLERVFRARLKSDRFADLPRELNVVAVDLDSGEAVAFGRRGRRDVPISKAVQASTALPGLYRPVRIKGRDYVDGGVRKTAHINLAIQSGADLVICINPIVPYLNDTAKGALRRPPQQPRRHLGARPGDAHHAARAHGVRDGALPARAPRGRHPADPADARRHAHVRLQHHAHQRAPHGGRARLPHGARVLPQDRRAPAAPVRQARHYPGGPAPGPRRFQRRDRTARGSRARSTPPWTCSRRSSAA